MNTERSVTYEAVAELYHAWFTGILLFVSSRCPGTGYLDLAHRPCATTPARRWTHATIRVTCPGE
mgnify:FL=1